MCTNVFSYLYPQVNPSQRKKREREHKNCEKVVTFSLSLPPPSGTFCGVLRLNPKLVNFA